MKKISVAALLFIFILALTGCANKNTYKIKITIPHDSTEAFAYSHEEISPIGNKITICAGENLGDSEVILKPIEYKEENAYEATYITPGLPVKMDVEKGAWYKIGVSSVKNQTGTDTYVYVEVTGVEVRIE